MSKVFINIVIPTLNEEENLKFLLPYLINECKVASKSIIISDSPRSQDNSRQVAGQYKVNYLIGTSPGRAEQMNEAASNSKAQVLAFLHADVIPPHNFVELINKSIQKGNAFGFFAYKFATNHPLLKINAYFTRYDGIFSGGGDQLQFIRRETFELLEGFDTRYKVMEDFELMDRIKRSNIKYTLLKEKVTVSDRKYQTKSYLRVNVIQLYIFVRYKLGMPPDQLAKLYASL